MKFESVKAMETAIAGFTNVDQLVGDITVTSQGEVLFLENIGSNANTGATETIYIARDTVDSLGVRFDGSGSSIKVTKTHLTRG